MRLSRVAIAALLSVLLSHATAQNTTTGPPSLTDLLDPLNINSTLNTILFSPRIIFVQTPIAIRYVILTVVGGLEIAAACDPKILSFFGTQDNINPKLCTQEDFFVIYTYITHRLVQSEYPDIAFSAAAFLTSIGLTPLSQSRDKNTRVGWANLAADRLIQYFSNDGWNSQGDLTRANYRRRFEDTSAYAPANPAHLAPFQLNQPLRWQPLTNELDFRGDFASQIHVVPHIGQTAKPLVLSEKDFRSRKVPGPYKSPNRRRNLNRADNVKMRKQLRDLFKLSTKVDTKEILLTYFWENKFASLGSFLTYYRQFYNYGTQNEGRLILGEMMAQHDAVMLAWKEKVRHDLTRPRTMMRRLLKGRMVRAFRGIGLGVGKVSADEWEPIIRTQPHSEFPSASATICQASLDHLKAALKEFAGNGSIPAYDVTLQPGTIPGSPITVPVDVRFDTIDDAIRSCGNSRLFAGLHFKPSVTAGYKLSRGVGELAFEHVRDLFAGKVPENCARCKNAKPIG